MTTLHLVRWTHELGAAALAFLSAERAAEKAAWLRANVSADDVREETATTTVGLKRVGSGWAALVGDGEAVIVADALTSPFPPPACTDDRQRKDDDDEHD